MAELNELLNEEKASEERILEAAKELETAIELETAKLLEESELVPEDPPYFIPPATDPTYDSVETITTIEDTVADSDLVIMFEPDISKIPAIIEEWNIKHPEQCLCVIDVPPINKEIYIYATSAAMNAKLPDDYKEMVEKNKENNKYNNIKKDFKVWSSKRNNITYLDTTKFI